MSNESIVDLVKHHQAQASNAPESAEVAQKAAVMAEAMPADRHTEEILEKLLQNVTDKMRWIQVELPSQGLLYPEAQKVVDIRPITFDDERMLKSTQGSRDAEGTLEKLLRNCIRGIDVSEMTPEDKLYVLYRLRGISYGDTYTLEHDCENCGTRSKLDLSINTLKTTPLKEEHMRFVLPDSQQEIQIKLPRTQDMHLVDTIDKMHENMHMFIHNIAGVSDKTVIEAFIQKTTVRDVDMIRTHIFSPEYGMENHFFYSCNACGTKNRVPIELTSNFFTAS